MYVYQVSFTERTLKDFCKFTKYLTTKTVYVQLILLTENMINTEVQVKYTQETL